MGDMQDRAQTGNDLEWARGGLEARGGKTVRNCFSPRGKSGNLFRWRKEKNIPHSPAGPDLLGVPNCSRVLLPSASQSTSFPLVSGHAWCCLSYQHFAFSLGLHRHLPCLGRRHLPSFPPFDGVPPLSSGHWFGDKMGPLRLLFLYRRTVEGDIR
ncbi:hypothetical protein BO99DRAFT_119195 [Aspergillus violaceofuscus CBS 115571]|uniref:Uncharacterized protein n=1 Tax=Aspergillus violaceofuscus (strain CBS 115571) TaxID=1450538 RepID=A0A2V5H794_ASPV1|nr:hypothetical protein BO99DRAFT_119195 [Aspergillus violaceofuscus CBS 115571]